MRTVTSSAQPPRRWMAAVELAVFISMGGYFALSLLGMAGQL